MEIEKREFTFEPKIEYVLTLSEEEYNAIVVCVGAVDGNEYERKTERALLPALDWQGLSDSYDELRKSQ